jgi:small ligand-binding sensory domain FIST
LVSATSGHGASPHWKRATDDALERCRRPDGTWGAEEPNVAFLYLTDYMAGNADAIRERVVRATGVRVLSGTLGVGVVATGVEHMDEPAVALLLLHLPEGQTKEVRIPGPGVLPPPTHSPVGILHADPVLGLALLSQSKVFGHTFLAGGLTSSRMPSLQLHTDGVFEGGASAVLLGAEVQVVTGVSQACLPAGPEHHVSGAMGTLVLTLDDRPALAVLLEDCGAEFDGDVRRMAGKVFVGHRPSGAEGEGYVVRPLVGFDDQHGVLAVAAEPSPGDALWFTRRDAGSALTDLRRMLQGLHARMPRPPSAGLYFSCASRGRNLFGEAGRETDLVREVLGDFPLAGFFGGGEVSGHAVHGHSGVLVLFA